MNKKIVSAFWLALAASVYSHLAVAHTLTGSLGNASTAIDYLQVRCFDDGAGPTDHLYLDIKKSTGTATLSLQALRDNTVVNLTAPNNGTTSGGYDFKATDGYFYLTVDKTAAGASNYVLNYHCKTSTNDHTGTEIFQLNNQ